MLFLNSIFDFLPTEVTSTIDNVYNQIIGKDENQSIVKSDKNIYLSEKVESPLFKHMDLLISKDVYIPTSEEIKNNYANTYKDTIFAVLPNNDIIIQDYGVKVNENYSLEDYRQQICSSLKSSRPDTNFDAQKTLNINNLKIPVIEFCVGEGEESIYSFVGFLNVNGNLVTIVLNSSSDYVTSSVTFSEILKNLIIK